MARLSLTARHPQVYEPCDDSFALEDALKASSSLIAHLRPRVCLEIGTGSGYVLAALCSLLQDLTLLSGTCVLGTDLSPYALATTQSTLRNHGFQADLLRTDLTSGLHPRLEGGVDLVLCNPPYVVTPESEVGEAGIVSSWAGGKHGRQVIDRILPLASRLLSPSGLFFLVTVSENRPCEVEQRMQQLGFSANRCLVRRTEEETLTVLLFSRRASV